MSSSICFFGASGGDVVAVDGLELALDVLDHLVDLGFRDPGALDTHGLGGTHRQEQGVALADQLLGARLVQDHAGVGDGGGGERHAGGHVGLDQAGDDVDGRALGGQHQVDAGGTGQLGDADDRVFDVARGHHHEVGEFVHDHQQVRVGPDDALGVHRRLDLAGADGLVEVVDVLEAVVGEVVVAGVHLADHPLQGLGGLLRVGDDRA